MNDFQETCRLMTAANDTTSGIGACNMYSQYPGTQAAPYIAQAACNAFGRVVTKSYPNGILEQRVNQKKLQLFLDKYDELGIYKTLKRYRHTITAHTDVTFTPEVPFLEWFEKNANQVTLFLHRFLDFILGEINQNELPAIAQKYPELFNKHNKTLAMYEELKKDFPCHFPPLPFKANDLLS